MKENQRLTDLLDRYAAGICTALEEDELMQIVASGDYDDVVRQYMIRAWHQHPVDHTLDAAHSERIRNVVLRQEKTTRPASLVPLSRRDRWVKVAAAAAILLLAGGWAAFHYIYKPASQTSLTATREHTVIPPGSDGAVLTLADGSTIVLDSASDGNLASQANIQVVKKGGHIQYLPVNKDGDNTSLYNTIGTARGKQFQLLLEDGTRVWLNAATTLRFPVSFSKETRDVEVSGEAYFDVAKDKKRAFRVKTGNTIVEVLGTQFNINSYQNEAAVSTTLIEGAVKVKQGNSQQLLSPGQQVQAYANGNIKTYNNVNTNEIVAWKNNLFSFKDTDIKTLMRQLERWYNVEAVFKGKTNESVTFNGDISRGVELGMVLKMLEMTGEVHFEIQGKTIVVTM